MKKTCFIFSAAGGLWIRFSLLAVWYLLNISTAPALAQDHYRVDESNFVTHVVDPSDLMMFWKNKDDEIIRSFDQLAKVVEVDGKELVFAMNGGMYHTGWLPVGAYVEKGEVLEPVNRQSGLPGNFYLLPNGVFYLTQKGRAVVVRTSEFQIESNVYYATQSGPMLLIDGEYHPKFSKNSSHRYIRNGVGILPDGRVMFAISRIEVTLYDMATLFLQNGCFNALYLDGSSSVIYLPSSDMTEQQHHFGVVIAEVKDGL